jgi:antibiotic biosynthesis monooxygenase (ABM) superfamily enzyme
MDAAIESPQMPPGELTVVIHRRIKPGREAEFERAMNAFVQVCLAAPGHRSIAVLRPTDGGRDYVVIDSFADAAARLHFKQAPAYAEWMAQLGRLTEGDPRIQELSGLEGWFTTANAHALATPPRYKMAAVTYLGVMSVVMTLALTLGPLIRTWPFLLYNAVFNGMVVVLLTWVVMPQLTRLFKRWLFPPQA